MTFSPDRMMVTPTQSNAHVWVRDGIPTLTIITDATGDFSTDWPECNGALIIFDASFDVTVTVVPS